jgi:hypothetical protein
LTAVLASGAASAGVPPQLAAASVRSAVALLLSSQTAAAVVPSAVATLVGGVLRRMLLHRLLATATLIFALATTLGGAATAWQLTRPVEGSLNRQPGLAQPSLRFEAAAENFLPARRSAILGVPGKPDIRLPAKPDTVVLRMKRSVDSSKLPGTVLTIFANGRGRAEVPEELPSLSPQDLAQYVRARTLAQGPGQANQQPRIKVLEGKVPIEELEELLRFALHDQEFFDFDQGAVRSALEKKPPTGDLSTSRTTRRRRTTSSGLPTGGTR